jgi:hypothetical protein
MLYRRSTEQHGKPGAKQYLEEAKAKIEKVLVENGFGNEGQTR